MSYLHLRPAKTEESPIINMVPVIGSFMPLVKRSWWQKLLGKQSAVLSLELFSYNQKTHFYIHPPDEYVGYVESQILSQYPKTLIIRGTDDPLAILFKPGESWAGAVLKNILPYAFPIQTFQEAHENDLLANVFGFLGKMSDQESGLIQFVLRNTSEHYWQQRIRSSMYMKDAEGNEVSSPYQSLFSHKINAPLLEMQIRLVVQSGSQEAAKAKLMELAGAFGAFQRAEANGFVISHLHQWQRQGFESSVKTRRFWRWSPRLIMNLHEAASLWHLPGSNLEHVKGIEWGKTIVSEAPDNIPVTEQTLEEDKRSVNFFARTEWRNHEAIFGIKREDRRKHMYLIGKTGTGKSTLIANMAINDIRNGEGVAVIDPHGDLSEYLLRYIPKRRINDVVYLDPTLSDERSFSLNLFDNSGAMHTDVVASGIVSVFYKLYHESWGPRLEYILRNAILTLLYSKQATFADIPALLTNKQYRLSVVHKVSAVDPVLTAFWNNEFEQMNEKLRVEAISPILNKVGQFLSAQRIRQIVGTSQSSFSLKDIMNEGKVLILNLSQGKLGEDTAALLGAMFITKMQLTAMERVNVPENERRDFYLYVDEFQNFATTSFIKILSEARKYRLNLILANQYVGQVDEDIQKAIFGNVGTLMTFLLGASDALIFEKEFGSVFKADDLVALKNFEIILKMAIDGLTSEPFVAKTLPLPSVINDNKEKILRVSLEKYYRSL